MTYEAHDDLAAFIAAFEGATLPREEWSHAAHLAVSIWYLFHHQEDEAADRMREGITRYNAAVGIPSSDRGGYNETVTLFWLYQAWSFMEREGRGWGAVTLANRFIAEYESRRELPSDFYSEELLWSDEARSSWVEPDLAELVSEDRQSPAFLP